MSKITYTAFNAVQNKVASVIGTPSGTTFDLGYNLPPNSAAANPGQIVYGSDLNRVVQDINVCYQHQTATQTALPTYPQGQIITASDLTAVSTIADAVYNNRNTVGVAQLSLSNSNSYANNSTWSSVHSHSVRLDWGSNAQFRGWANLAGYITINLGILGGDGGQQTNSWANLLASVGTIVIGAGATVQQNAGTGGTGTYPNGGLYNCLANGPSNSSYPSMIFYIADSDTVYTSNKLKIYVYPYGGSGVLDVTGVTITCTLEDGHQPPAHTTSDTVTGTLNMTFNTYYAFGKTPNVSDLGNSVS